MPIVQLPLSLLSWVALVIAQENSPEPVGEGKPQSTTISSVGIVAITLTVVGAVFLACAILPIPWRKIRQALRGSRGKKYKNVPGETEEGAPLQTVESRESGPLRSSSPTLASHEGDEVGESARASQEALSMGSSQETIRPINDTTSEEALYDPGQDPHFPEEGAKGRSHGGKRFQVAGLLGAGA